MPATLPIPALPAAFVAASLVLALTPGPAVVYIVTRSLTQGRASGLASVAGVALGNLGNAVAASLGLAALFAWSALAFGVVKWAGVGYLLWLAWQTLRSAPAALGVACAPASLSRVFRDAFWVALLNPKTTLYFAAFLPQFVTPAPPAALQCLTFGTVFVAIAGCTDALYVLASAWLAPRVARLRGAARAARWTSAGAYLGLGLYTAFGGRAQR